MFDFPAFVIVVEGVGQVGGVLQQHLNVCSVALQNCYRNRRTTSVGCQVSVGVVLQQQLQTLCVALKRSNVHQAGSVGGPCLVWVGVRLEQCRCNFGIASTNSNSFPQNPILYCMIAGFFLPLRSKVLLLLAVTMPCAFMHMRHCFGIPPVILQYTGC